MQTNLSDSLPVDERTAETPCAESIHGHGPWADGKCLMCGYKRAATVPVVGMGATLAMWSDRHPYTITRVSPNGRTIWARRDRAERIDGNGMSECQSYTYHTDLEAAEQRFTWGEARGTYRGSNGTLVIGVRSRYYDYSF